MKVAQFNVTVLYDENYIGTGYIEGSIDDHVGRIDGVNKVSISLIDEANIGSNHGLVGKALYLKFSIAYCKSMGLDRYFELKDGMLLTPKELQIAGACSSVDVHVDESTKGKYECVCEFGTEVYWWMSIKVWFYLKWGDRVEGKKLELFRTGLYTCDRCEESFTVSNTSGLEPDFSPCCGSRISECDSLEED